MSCSELYSALRWLQLQPSVDLVHEAMRRLDTDDDGCLTVDDFVCALQRDQPNDFSRHLKRLSPLWRPAERHEVDWEGGATARCLSYRNASG